MFQETELEKVYSKETAKGSNFGISFIIRFIKNQPI